MERETVISIESTPHNIAALVEYAVDLWMRKPERFPKHMDNKESSISDDVYRAMMIKEMCNQSRKIPTEVIVGAVDFAKLALDAKETK